MKVFKNLSEAIAQIMADCPQNARLNESVDDLKLGGIAKLDGTIYIVDEYNLLADVTHVLNNFQRNKLREEYLLLDSSIGLQDLDIIIGFDRYCEERKTSSFSDMMQSLEEYNNFN